MRSRILVGLITGSLGGLVGWFLQEILIHYRATVVNGACTAVPLSGQEQVTLTLCVGGIIGMCLGSMDGVVESNGRKLRLGLIVGLIAGAIGGGIGMQMGAAMYGMLGGSMTRPDHATVFAFVRQMVARASGMTLLGVAVGCASSLSSRSIPRIRNGIIGGLLGGLFGGFLFDILPTIIVPVGGAVGDMSCRDVGGASRAVGFISIGAFTGFFIGLVQELLKEAWVKVLAGKNEGKDFILERPMNLLGRDEKCEVPLFGDSSVAIQHAAIRSEGHRHVLIDGKSPSGTLVNGQRLASGAEQMLRDGDMIQIGSHRILFREKATASQRTRSQSETVRSTSPASAVAVPSHLCPYCGAAKDASGKCMCSLDAGSRAGSPMPATAYAPAPQFTPTTAYAPVAAGSATMLTCMDGPYAGQGFPLNGPNISVGRDEACMISLKADSTVSRSHATLLVDAGILTVVDNGSSNGTFINGVRVAAPISVVPGDVIQFGSSKFRVE